MTETTDDTPRTLVDSQAAAMAVGVGAATIRKWAQRGHLPRRGKDHKGRTLYWINDVYTAAARHKRPIPRDTDTA